MSLQQPAIDSSIVKALYPLSLVADHLIEKLIERTRVKLPELGQSIIKRSSTVTSEYHYLIEGSVEHRISFDQRKIINSRDSASANPLEECLKRGGSIKSGEGCCILVVNTSDVDEFLSLSQSKGFKVAHIDESTHTVSGQTVVEGEHEDDWTERFLKSQLAVNIPASTMINMFSSLEDIEVDIDDEIIKENTPGDYFYIIKIGYAEVKTNPAGPFDGEDFTLSPGDYFGDEALVADTTRNATVVMKESGLLGRLSNDNFHQIIKEPLMQSLSKDDLKAIEEEKVCYLDVRLMAEFRHEHYETAKNHPIAYIRKHLNSFDHELIYVITPGCGRRGELAVYLLKQAGYQVYLMAD
ncbi:MAG: CRP-like cAMP-binding protein [Pseudohongiellaceae bacterium]|jgi:CRP-like cAMP-binding protein